MVHVVLMTILKINLPAKINESFRRIVSRRRGAQKGVLKNATLTAISRYIGSDPEIALIATEYFLSIETPTQMAPKVLSVILSDSEVLFSVRLDMREVEEKIGKVEATYKDENYTVFSWKPTSTDALCSLESFRGRSGIRKS